MPREEAKASREAVSTQIGDSFRGSTLVDPWKLLCTSVEPFTKAASTEKKTIPWKLWKLPWNLSWNLPSTYMDASIEASTAFMDPCIASTEASAASVEASMRFRASG